MTDSSLVGSIDQGTSSTRFMIFEAQTAKGKVETHGFPTPELLPVCARDVQPLLWKLRSGDRGDWIANGIVVPSAPSYRTE